MQAAMITQALILAGGRGSRLGPLAALCPASALPVGDRPFLAYIFAYLRDQGVRDIIVCAGHLAQELEDYTRPWAKGVQVRYVREEQALGTGGAVRHCLPLLHERFFVWYGNSLFRTPLQALAQALVPPLAATLAVRDSSCTGQSNSLHLEEGVVQAVYGLSEAGGQREQLTHSPQGGCKPCEARWTGLTHGGIIAMHRASVCDLPAGPCSLEQDFFPAAVTRGHLGGIYCEGLYVDITSTAAYAASHRRMASSTVAAPRKAVFLDRDGTLIVEKNYLHNPEDVEILPHVVAGLDILQKAGFALIVVTNQSGIGRGYYSVEDMQAVNARLTQCLSAEGIKLSGVYYCPHSPDTVCLCRKPLPGMLAQAAAELGLDMGRIATVGDKDCDVLMGRYLGGKGVGVRTGYGARGGIDTRNADYIADTFLDAATYILHTV